LLYCKHKGAEI